MDQWEKCLCKPDLHKEAMTYTDSNNKVLLCCTHELIVYVTICEDLDKFKTTHMTDKGSEKVSPSLVRKQQILKRCSS